MRLIVKKECKYWNNKLKGCVFPWVYSLANLFLVRNSTSLDKLDGSLLVFTVFNILWERFAHYCSFTN